MNKYLRQLLVRFIDNLSEFIDENDQQISLKELRIINRLLEAFDLALDDLDNLKGK